MGPFLLLALSAAPLGARAQAPGGGRFGGQPTLETHTGPTYSFEASSSPVANLGAVYHDYGPWSNKSSLVGTWSTKSQMVLTGPDFYDPVDELLIEPALPGISYSFTEDGFWEEAIYQVTSNGSMPTCATGSLIFQHGTYELADNGTLTLYPFEVDGRQLLSDPCGYSKDSSLYSRYNQTEVFSKFQVYVDLYYGRYRLDLYQFDGSPMPPMYLVYRPPNMLPTITMNPTSNSSGSSSTSKSARSVRERVRRSLRNVPRTSATKKTSDYNTLWWIGMTLMAAGTIGFVALS